MTEFKQVDYASDDAYFRLRKDLLKTKFSFSQSLEDLRLQRVLTQDTGFFVDIGSAHAVDESTTFFLSRKGWPGICVDAFPQREDLYSEIRHESKLIKTIINDGTPATFYKIFYESGEWTGLSTSSKEVADMHAANGFIVSEVELLGTTLKDLLIKNNVVSDFDLLSLDLEGTAKQALSYGFFEMFRPKVICLESTFPLLSTKDTDLIDFVRSHRYTEIVFDGLNSFFVPEELADRYGALADQPNPFVDGQYYQWRSFVFGIKNNEIMEEWQ